MNAILYVWNIFDLGSYTQTWFYYENSTIRSLSLQNKFLTTMEEIGDDSGVLIGLHTVKEKDMLYQLISTQSKRYICYRIRF